MARIDSERDANDARIHCIFIVGAVIYFVLLKPKTKKPKKKTKKLKNMKKYNYRRSLPKTFFLC